MIHLGVPTVVDLAYLAEHMREDERAQWCALLGAESYDSDIAARIFATTQGFAWCLYEDDMPLVAAGLQPIQSGVYQTWMVGTADAWERHWRRITKECRRMFDGLLADGTARRIQTYALESRVFAHQWYAKGLGQHYEGTLAEWFTDGQNAVCYAVTRKHWEARRGKQ